MYRYKKQNQPTYTMFEKTKFDLHFEVNRHMKLIIGISRKLKKNI